MKKKPTKPTGNIGVVALSPEGASFQRIEFPRTKDEIEEFIVKAFVGNSAGMPLQIVGFSQNVENDFDFTIKTSEGTKYLELMEVAPLENLRGSYAQAPDRYKPYDFALHVAEKINGKSERYEGSAASQICLLIYITDWAFTLSDTVIALLQHWAATTSHSFQYVFCYSPFDRVAGDAKLIYPTPAEFWNGFDPEKFRDNEVFNLSPLKWEVATHGNL